MVLSVCLVISEGSLDDSRRPLASSRARPAFSSPLRLAPPPLPLDNCRCLALLPHLEVDGAARGAGVADCQFLHLSPAHPRGAPRPRGCEHPLILLRLSLLLDAAPSEVAPHVTLDNHRRPSHLSHSSADGRTAQMSLDVHNAVHVLHVPVRHVQRPTAPSSVSALTHPCRDAPNDESSLLRPGRH